MTVYVTILPNLSSDKWDYSYDDEYDALWVERIPRDFPQSTLQGAYSLIIKVDTAMIISYFETITIAGPKYWKVMPYLESPDSVAGQLIVTRDVDDGQTQVYFTNPDYNTFYTRFGEVVEPAKLSHVAIGSQLIVDITQEGMLAGVWMLDLPPEISKKHIMQQSM